MPKFNREAYVERVTHAAIIQPGSLGACGECGRQAPRWALPTALGRELAPPRQIGEDAGPPENACPKCWAEWSADLWARDDRGRASA